MVEAADKLFSELLNELSLENVASGDTFRAIFNSTPGDELLRERYLQRLRKRAVDLGMRAGEFDASRRAFEKDAAAREKAELLEHQQQQAALFRRAYPAWIAEDGSVSEEAFCDEFQQARGLKCISGAFYSPMGSVPTEKVKSEVQTEIAPYIQKKLAARVNDLTDALKNFSYMEPPDPEPNVIHTANGELDIGAHGSFTFVPAFRFCLNRIAAEYHADAPKPELWLKFLNDLLYPEDIPTLQEFLGYCLVPTTKAQKMLMLIGSGGEGKSVVGAVVKAVLGRTNTTSGKLNNLDEKQFAAANLENKLLFVDDDLRTKSADESATVKEIITCFGRMNLERKGVQAYEGNMYCRLMAFGNQDYRTLHDQSDGAFRRRIILFARPKPDGRADDKDLVEKLCAERDGILLWMLDGLLRLMQNDWDFTISDRAKANLEQSKRDSFNVIAFLEDDSVIQLGGEGVTAQCSAIYTAYQLWCTDNAEYPVTQKTLINYMEQHASTLKIRYSTHIHKYNHRARGFFGVQIIETQNGTDSWHA